MEKYQHIPDRHQNFWQLSCIQSTALGLPGIIIGGQLSVIYGAGTAVISVCIGNIILWIIGLTIISMAAVERKNAIENIRKYLGKGGSTLAAWILMIAFLSWYLLQIKSVSAGVSVLFSDDQKWQGDIRIGVALGLLTALLSIGGIRLIKWTCVIAFPLLLSFLFYAIIVINKPVSFIGTWGISMPGIISVMSVTLPGVVNLPTFFRHSRSRADSFLALTLMTVFVSLFQVLSIYLNISEFSGLFTANERGYGINVYLVFAFGFLVLSSICVNLVNIYFASAGFEMIFPHRWSIKEYAIVGLLGTAGYAFLQTFPPMQFLEEMADNFISSLGAVLLLAFLVKILVRHRPRPLEKIVNIFCWFMGGVTATIVLIHNPGEPWRALIGGFGSSLMVFLFISFLEESIWAIRKIFLGEKT